jgi:hypothetical protein
MLKNPVLKLLVLNMVAVSAPLFADTCDNLDYKQAKSELSVRKDNVDGAERGQISAELSKLLEALGPDSPETKDHFWQQVKSIKNLKGDDPPSMSGDNKAFLFELLQGVNARYQMSVFIEGLRTNPIVSPRNADDRNRGYLAAKENLQIPKSERISGPESGALNRQLVEMLNAYGPTTKEMQYSFWKQCSEILGSAVAQPSFENSNSQFLFDLIQNVNARWQIQKWISGVKVLPPFQIQTP